MEDIFSISGRGTVVTGQIERGVVKVGDAVEIVGMRASTLRSSVTGIEMFQRTLTKGKAGDNVGLLLQGIDKSQVDRGMVVARPDSVAAHTRFRAQLLGDAAERRGLPAVFFERSLQVFLHAAVVPAEIVFDERSEMLEPEALPTIKLLHPMALEPDMRFEIRDGSRRLAIGRVINILE